MSDVEPMQVVSTTLSDEGRAVLAQLRGMGATTANTRAEPFDDVEVASPLGFESRPVVTDNTEAIVLRDGQGALILFLVDKGRARLTDLEDGETRVSGAKEVAAMIRILPSGKIEITALSGQDVVVNGGNKSVARMTDGVEASAALATFMTQVAAYINGIAPGSVTVPVGDIGAISSGAPNFLG